MHRVVERSVYVRTDTCVPAGGPEANLDQQPHAIFGLGVLEMRDHRSRLRELCPVHARGTTRESGRRRQRMDGRGIRRSDLGQIGFSAGASGARREDTFARAHWRTGLSSLSLSSSRNPARGFGLAGLAGPRASSQREPHDRVTPGRLYV